MFLWPGVPIVGDVTSPPASPGPDVAPDVAPSDAGASRAPPAVGPMALRVGGDGRWAPVSVDSGPTVMWKTTLHPDLAKTDAAVFVVAIDLSRTRLRAVAGATEPQAVPPAPGYVRNGVIPEADQPALLAAWNGGWKSEHGHYGMQVDGVTLAAPKENACTIAAYDDDGVRIAPWRELAETEPHMLLFRQAPACFYVHNARNPGLAAPLTTNWGAAADGNPVIRRSAMGIDAQGAFLFVGVSNATTAPAMADGMHHAGAADVMELDVNWAFPRFLVFRPDASGRLAAQTLFPSFVFEKDQYVSKRSQRDFFYLIRR
jgi:hypothetical protein